MIYTSPNGYTGVVEKDNFMGFKHWDLSIFDEKGSLYITQRGEISLPRQN